jgi:hypothetical protein
VKLNTKEGFFMQGNSILADLETQRERTKARTFLVEITETLQRTIEVQAADRDSAYEIVKAKYDACEYVLDSSDFIGVDFDAQPAEPLKLKEHGAEL